MLHVVTTATESMYYLPYLYDTCAKNGVELTVLGYGEKWNGYIFKLEKMVSFLRSIDIGDIVCFVDGYDVICTRNLGALVQTFLNIRERERCQIVIAKDGGTIIPSFISDMYFGSCKNNFINTGTYIGFAGDILTTILESIDMYPTEKDDQRLLTNYCNKFPDKFYIDVNYEVFYAHLYPLTEAKIVGSPFFVHAPGCGYLDSILTDMGYDVDTNIKPALRKYFFKKSSEHAVVFLKRYIFWVILIILIIVFLTMNK